MPLRLLRRARHHSGEAAPYSSIRPDACSLRPAVSELFCQFLQEFLFKQISVLARCRKSRSCALTARLGEFALERSIMPVYLFHLIQRHAFMLNPACASNFSAVLRTPMRNLAAYPCLRSRCHRVRDSSRQLARTIAQCAAARTIRLVLSTCSGAVPVCAARTDSFR